jgi:hypothetical protein
MPVPISRCGSRAPTGGSERRVWLAGLALVPTHNTCLALSRWQASLAQPSGQLSLTHPLIPAALQVRCGELVLLVHALPGHVSLCPAVPCCALPCSALCVCVAVQFALHVHRQKKKEKTRYALGRGLRKPAGCAQAPTMAHAAPKFAPALDRCVF